MDFALFFVFVFLGTLFFGIGVLLYTLWRVGRGDWYAVIFKRKHGET